jgi:SAM-dependent methyltransferase
MATEVKRSALPPQAILYQMAAGHYVARALNLAATLGIADLLKDGPRPIDELAAASATHAPSLRRVMRLLAAAGVFEERENGDLALTTLGECLRGDVPGSVRATVMLIAGVRHQDNWKELEYCVRTGEPAFRKRGVSDPFAELAQYPEEAANFDAAMADFTKLAAMAIAGAYDFAELRTIVDVGGGNGALLVGILAVTPHLQGIVFDQPHAVERATTQIAEAALAERCRGVGGDFFTEVPSGGDGYVLKHVIHDWDDGRALVILKNCHRAMGPKGRLLVVEGVYPPHIDQSWESRGATANDVNMLVATGGRQRSEAEFRALYAAAGFELTRIIPTLAGVSVIEGIPC